MHVTHVIYVCTYLYIAGDGFSAKQVGMGERERGSGGTKVTTTQQQQQPFISFPSSTKTVFQGMVQKPRLKSWHHPLTVTAQPCLLPSDR